MHNVLKRKKKWMSLLLTSAVALVMMLGSVNVVFAGAGADAGGSVSGGGTGPNNYTMGYSYVWFDQGGFAHQRELDPNFKPTQGWYSTKDGWHAASNGKSTINFFISLLDTKIHNLCKKAGYADFSDDHWDGFNEDWSSHITKKQMQAAAEEACIKAIARANENVPANEHTDMARVVGMGLNFYATDTGHRSGWSTGYHTSSELEYEDIIQKKGKDSELPNRLNGALVGWDLVVGPRIPSAKPDEVWRDYIYRMGKKDNPDVNYNGGRVIILAVADNWPETTRPVKIKKVSSNATLSNNKAVYALNNAVFGIYDESGTEVARLSTDANGETPTKRLLPGTYTVKELTSPLGFWLNSTPQTISVQAGEDEMTVQMDDPPMHGQTGVILQKVIKDPWGNPRIFDPNNNFTGLGGAKFEVKYYDNLNGDYSGAPKNVWILETDDDGQLELNDSTIRVGGDNLYTHNGQLAWPIGTYTFQETDAPDGFLVNSKLFVGTLTPVPGYQSNPNYPAPAWTMLNPDPVGNDIIMSYRDRSSSVIIEEEWFGGIRVRKVDRATGRPEPEGDGTFDKTVFSIINRSGESVQASPTGRPEDLQWYADGAEIMTITSNADGVAETPAQCLLVGNFTKVRKYEIREKVQPVGYNKNEAWSAVVSLKEAHKDKVNEVTDLIPNDPKKYLDEPVIRGGVKIHKDDNDLADAGLEGADKPQGDATLAGAEFTIVNKSKKSVVVRNVPYLTDTTPTVNWNVPFVYPIKNGTKEVQPGEVVGIMKTDAKGHATTLASDLPYGTYEITETKASKGYKIDKTWKVSFEVREEGVIVDKTAPHVEEPVIRGGVKLQKWDKELNKSEALGGKDHDSTTHEGPDLNNIKFTIKNVSGHSVVTPKDIDASIKGSVAPLDIDYSEKPGKFSDERLQEVPTGGIVGIITTNWSEEEKAYIAYTQIDALPYGTYEIWESRTNKFYELTDKHVATVEIREDGKYVVDANGKVTGERDKPFYVVKDKSGADLVWKDYVWRQGVELTKIFDSNSNRGGFIPFKITNTTTGEYHYVVTDRNGYMNTEKMPHSQNTNAYDEMMDKAIAEGTILTQEDFRKMRLSEDGVDVTTPGYWFYLGEDGTKAPVDDAKAALPYGQYEIEEIKVDINKKYSMQKFTFWVNQDEDKSYDTKYPVVNLDTITNDEIVIKTNAVDSETKDHNSTRSEKTTVLDEVDYEGLIAGKTYVMKGTLMKKITDEEGNVTSDTLTTPVETKDEAVAEGKEYYAKAGDKFERVTPAEGQKPTEEGWYEMTPVMAEKEFEAGAGGKGKVTLEFTFDSNILESPAVVAFEDLYKDGVKIATHADINDEDQTVYFPSIKTVAVDKNTGEHTLTPEKGILGIIGKEKYYVTDTVLYEGLVPGERYEVEGVLMKVTKNAEGEYEAIPLKDKNGDAVTGKESFKAEKSSGSVQIEFKFDAEGLGAGKIVAYETLTSNGKTVAEHKDPSDANQTVEIPADPSYEMYKIRTTAATVKPDTDKYGFQAGETVSYDVVIKNTGNVDLTMDVTDEFDGEAKDYFTTPVFKEVKGGTKNSVAEDKNTVNITVKAGETATVTYETTVAFTAKEYLAPAADDSDSLNDAKEPCNRTEQTNEPDDKDGYKNTAKTSNVTYPDPFNPDNPIDMPDGSKQDDAQTPVKGLELKTNAVDAESGEHVGLVRDKVKIQDKVTYTGLVPGKTYTVVGTLMDKETNAPLGTKDAPKKSEAKSESKSESTDANTKTTKENLTVNSVGTATALGVTADVYNWGAIAKYTKATDYVSYDGMVAAAEKTMDSAIGKPYVGQDISGIASGADKSLALKEGDSLPTFLDDLEAGKEGAFYAIVYLPKSVDGKDAFGLITIHVKNEGTETAHMGTCPITKIDRHLDATEQTTEEKKSDENADTTKTEAKAPAKGITVTKTFKAENADGHVVLDFEFSGIDMSNKSVVAFERLYEGTEADESKLVATHEDINDPDQTVVYPTIDTKASYKDGVITDTVTYTNLIPGLEYELTGELMDKETGNSMEITAMTKFTPKEANGSVDMQFEVDAKKLNGKSVVVFETLKLNGKIVAEHKDINDADQTVKIGENTPKKDTPKDSSKGDTPREGYKTGDFLPYILGGVLVALAIAIAVVMQRKRKHE